MPFSASDISHGGHGVRHASEPRARRARTTALGAIAVGLIAVLAACGTSTTGQVATPTGTPGPSTPAVPGSPSASARIGADCAAIPPASELRGMSTSQVLTTLQKDPQLSDYAAATSSAALGAMLNPEKTYTLFVPSNAAFASVPASKLAKLQISSQLIRTLKYHIVSGQLSPQQFTARARPTTLEGARLALTQKNSTFQVNDATVQCGNIRAATVTIYIINKILWPPG